MGLEPHEGRYTYNARLVERAFKKRNIDYTNWNNY